MPAVPVAGRELDALVAEKVMGNPYRRYDRVLLNGTWVEGETWIPVRDWLAEGHLPPGGYVGMSPPRYSTDIAAAWEVVEHLKRLEPLLSFSPRFGVWICIIDGDENSAFQDFDAQEATAPHAICLAALQAVGAIPRQHGP